MRVHVDTGRAYDITIERGALSLLGRTVKELGAGKAAVVSDSKVFPLYGDAALKSLNDAGVNTCTYVFPSGEQSKNLDNFGKIVNFMADNRLTRGDVAVALGGGVTGDMTGFAAACYQRGIRYVQVPTTLLAMVDSSVGGKTAVDLGSGKNLCGAFWQPSAVLCDPNLLKTLDDETFADGCGEVVKYAMLGCREIEDIIINGELNEKLDRVIELSVRAKRDVVSEDERDTGMRRLLNFGHTVGHAVELSYDYRRTHGSCVAIGMELITRAAVKQGRCSQARLETLEKMLRCCNLPMKCEFTAEQLFAAACGDKKVNGSRIALIIPNDSECFAEEIELEKLLEWIELGI